MLVKERNDIPEGVVLTWTPDLAHSLLSKKKSSVREVTLRVCRSAERHKSYIVDPVTGRKRYAVHFNGWFPRGIRPSGRALTFEGLEFWIRMSMLHLQRQNRDDPGLLIWAKKKAVVSEGVSIGIGSPTSIRVTVSGIITGFDTTALYMDAVAMMVAGKNLLPGGKPQPVTVKMCKISHIALYKPWSLK